MDIYVSTKRPLQNRSPLQAPKKLINCFSKTASRGRNRQFWSLRHNICKFYAQVNSEQSRCLFISSVRLFHLFRLEWLMSTIYTKESNQKRYLISRLSHHLVPYVFVLLSTAKWDVDHDIQTIFATSVIVYRRS